ncbi:MAG: hypothetical protein OEU54_09600, partial [Gemmatimonadota bacterium]|nr:hypothetical protein [Gemmatimonadota bacterium]
ISAHARDMLSRKSFQKAKEAVLAVTPEEPIFIAVDSMDHYSVSDDAVMYSTAALVMKASQLNAAYSHRGVHTKVFLTDEIFPYFKENVCNNPAKYIKDPLFLHWRPKDLARLICWRFYKFLLEDGGIDVPDVAWDRYNDVIDTVWTPHFGTSLVNANGVSESTFPYVLRHTQMRPRQLVMMCNEIARVAQDRETFPDCPPEVLRAAVHRMELSLADEVVNSYGKIYPHAGEIVGALSGMPMAFPGNELDRIAPRTAAHWPDGEYSPDAFKRLVTELGVIGRKRGDSSTGIIEADFEFLLEDRLFLTEQDTCVIHPMFYRKLNVQPTEGVCVYPFPDHPDFEELRNGR